MKTVKLRLGVLESGLLLLFLILSVVSCSEKDGTPDTSQILHCGEHFEFHLTDEAESVNEPKVTCVLKDETGRIFRRDAYVQKDGTSSILSFLQGLAEGKFLLLALEYEAYDQNDKDGVVSVGVGRYLEAMNNVIRVTGAYNSQYDFGGSGTKDDPYKINCDTDLYNLQAYVNSDGGEKLFVGAYFEQTTDIDLFDRSYYINFEYGWQPIGKSTTNSFQGFYNGNGYKVTGLFINRPNQSAVGLFGCLYKAEIRNLTVEGASIVGDGAVGGIVGGVRGAGDKIWLSRVANCKLVSCSVKGNVGVGGIVGMNDVLTHLAIDSCSVEASNKLLCSSYGIGGILGAGVTNSAVSIMACENRAQVPGCLKNMGGIAGGVDTAIVISCYNYGEVCGSATDSQVLGVGGIIGGSGIANLIDVHNYGNVSGYKGVGGVLGSTLVTCNDDGSNAVYNSAYIQSSHNDGVINGFKMVGGLCGEAQIAVSESYNNNSVTASDNFAGGIVGATSVAAIHSSNNFGDISGKERVGGIAGQVQEGSYALNTNFGNVTGTVDDVGGIFGKSGNQSIINYCGNYGTIKLSGSGSVGGIVGEIGDPRKWNGWDIFEVVLGSFEFVTAGLGAAFAVIPHSAEVAHTVVHWVHFGMEIAAMVGNVVTNAYTAHLLHYPAAAVDPEEAELVAALISQNSERHYMKMESLVSSHISSATFSASDLKLLPGVMTNLEFNRSEMLSFYRKSEENHDFFNERINEVREERYEEVEHNKHSSELAHTIVQGICMVVSLITIIGASVATGGVATGFVVAGVVGGVVGGLNSVTKGAGNYDANTIEISQCFNFGKIEGQSNEVAGIAGRMADFSMLTDCLNGGEYPSTAYPLAGNSGGSITVQNSLDLYGEKIRHISCPNYGIGTEFKKNKIYCWGYDEEDISELHYYDLADHGLSSRKDVLSLERLCDKSYYEGWDFDENGYWAMPYNGAVGEYPIPKVSKMSVKGEEKPSY